MAPRPKPVDYGRALHQSTRITLGAVSKDFRNLEFRKALGSSLKALGFPPRPLPLLAASQPRARDPSSAVSLCIDSGQSSPSASTLASSEALPLPVHSRLGVILTQRPWRLTKVLRSTPRLRVPRRPTPLLPVSQHSSPAAQWPPELSSLILSSSASRSAQFRRFSLGLRLERPRLA